MRVILLFCCQSPVDGCANIPDCWPNGGQQGAGIDVEDVADADAQGVGRVQQVAGEVVDDLVDDCGDIDARFQAVADAAFKGVFVQHTVAEAVDGRYRRLVKVAERLPHFSQGAGQVLAPVVVSRVRVLKEAA